MNKYRKKERKKEGYEKNQTCSINVKIKREKDE